MPSIIRERLVVKVQHGQSRDPSALSINDLHLALHEMQIMCLWSLFARAGVEDHE